jgi:putative membrane-bound dehydrogenase-like protein
MKLIAFSPLCLLFTSVAAVAAPAVLPHENARRLEILFLGAPKANSEAHDPVERYRETRKHLGVSGINFTYTENLADLNPEMLTRFDALMLYGNWPTLAPDQEKALVDYVESGHGFLPIHCASACFGHSEPYVNLVGGVFKSHESGVFKTTITDPQHPVMRGYQGFETWDETYVHDRLTSDRKLLQKREDEPWTWVRTQGKGRVFYTAYGHDMRCWTQPEFNDLLRRGIMWAVGDEARAKLLALKLPTLKMEEAKLPGYRERAVITKAQAPLSPTESMKLAQVPNGFEISLFASDPDIVNPIYVAWDERGRAYVVQTVDYPNNVQTNDLGHDSIKLCEDTDGDGRADKFTVFADKLSLPTAMVAANGGIICSNGPQILFLKDTNDDGKADVRQVLFTGFGIGDTHAGVSNLRYGFDNWIYATVGYSGFNGEVGGQKMSFSMGVFRFTPDGKQLEYIQSTTNNTWGLGFSSDFDLMGSTANGNPSWYVTFPKHTYEKASVSQPRTPSADSNPMIFPITRNVRQVDQFDRFTAGSGHAFIASTRLPETYKDRVALVSEPTAKLVGQFEVERKGSEYVSTLSPNNLYSSADEWSSPVFAEEGPDGAIWVCDWYNLIIQHNPTPTKASAGYDAVTGKGAAYETPERDLHQGRIYRIYPKGTKDETKPILNLKSPETLVAALAHPNLFWRLQAQRLIVENNIVGAVPGLKRAVASDKPGAIQAFHALHALGALDSDVIKLAYASPMRGLRRAAVQIVPAEATLTIRDGKIHSLDDRDLAETLVALASTPPSLEVGKAIYNVLIEKESTFQESPTLKDAWMIAANSHAGPVLLAAADAVPREEKKAGAPAPPPNLIPNGTFSQKAGDVPNGWTLQTYIVDDSKKVRMEIAGGGRSGACLMIESPISADVGASVDVEVLPNRRYRLSAWIKTENLKVTNGMGAMLNVHGIGGQSQPVTGTKDWTFVQSEFDTGNANNVRIHCLFGGYGGSTGKAWWDDVSLVLIGPEVGGAGPTPWLVPLAGRFTSTGSPEQKKVVLAALRKRGDGFGDAMVTAIGAQPESSEPEARKFKPDPAVHKRGQEVYTRTCIACHGPEGLGTPGAFPPLAGSDWPTGDPTLPIKIVLHGMQGEVEVNGEKYNNIMAPLGNLPDQEIADVLTYVRQSWGNDAGPVNAATVKKVRAETKRDTPWTSSELGK